MMPAQLNKFTKKPEQGGKDPFIDRIFLLVLCFVLVLGIGGFLVIDEGWTPKDGIWSRFIEHISMALVVAAVLGIFYEFFISKLRDGKPPLTFR